MVAPPLLDGAVALDGDDGVVAVGSRAALRHEFSALPEERAQGALLPGLINAHAHLELSSLAGQIPGGDGLVAWTRRLATRAHSPQTAEPAEPAAQAAAVETAAVEAARAARALGAAAVADVGNGTAGWRALGQAGLAGLFFHELLGSRDARSGDALADAAAERASVPERQRPDAERVPVVPAAHAPYSASPDLLRRIFAAAGATGHPTSIHLAEDPDEIALLRDGGGAWAPVLREMGVEPETRAPGLRPVAYLRSLGAFAALRPPLLVHMVEADADDRRGARAAGATVVLCPRSNLHVGGKLPDVPALLADGVPLALGTDSLASAPDLSLWAEVALLAGRYPDVAPATWLLAATRGGAAALDLPRLGALQAGARPGLLDVYPAGLAGRAGDAGLSSEDAARALIEDPRPAVRWMAAA
jgi:aminodeoxyfutalosine deaminase